MTDEQRIKWDRLSTYCRNPNTVPHGEIEVPAGLILAADDQIRLFAGEIARRADRERLILDGLRDLLSWVTDQMGDPEEDDDSELAVIVRKARELCDRDGEVDR